MPRASRLCTDCPTVIREGTRCVSCTRRVDAARGTSYQRGYDLSHLKRRRAAEPEVEAGRVSCWRCGLRITPGQAWDLGHDDSDRSVYRGPEHAACNRATSGRRLAP